MIEGSAAEENNWEGVWVPVSDLGDEILIPETCATKYRPGVLPFGTWNACHYYDCLSENNQPRRAVCEDRSTHDLFYHAPKAISAM